MGAETPAGPETLGSFRYTSGGLSSTAPPLVTSWENPGAGDSGPGRPETPAFKFLQQRNFALFFLFGGRCSWE